MAIMSILSACLCDAKPELKPSSANFMVDEKTPLRSYECENPMKIHEDEDEDDYSIYTDNAHARTPSQTGCEAAVDDAEGLADEIVSILRTATKRADVQEKLKSAIRTRGSWSLGVAHAFLAALESLLARSYNDDDDDEQVLGPVLAEMLHKAEDAARAVFEFADEHPYLVAGFVTIVAVGVLVELAPWVVEAVGFAKAGPLEGSFAAWWQSTYAGFVPEGSLFSFFQRLGMLWGRTT